MSNKKFNVDIASIRDLIDRFKIAIPDFQRGYVWKKSKRKLLLNSLLNGFPIGAITLYKKNKDERYIIDGLQRLNTLKLYYKKPSEIISFEDYYKKVFDKINDWIKKYGAGVEQEKFKHCLKIWYCGLDELYMFERFSYFHDMIMKNSGISEEYLKIEYLEDLFNILDSYIDIEYDMIPLIIYEGERDDLPELFKNINSGSMALSPYEIFQSIWSKYKLDDTILSKEKCSYESALEYLDSTYVIDSKKENNYFDIFKSLISVNYDICCIDGVNCLFRNFVKDKSDKNRSRKFNNDSVAFEIYSTLICNTSNKVDKAVNILFETKPNVTEISKFIKKINKVILEKIIEAVRVIKNKNIKLVKSKYHGLYVLYSLVLSEYNIDYRKLKIEKRNKVLTDVYNRAFKFENTWFKDENRQIGFFKEKIKSIQDAVIS